MSTPPASGPFRGLTEWSRRLKRLSMKVLYSRLSSALFQTHHAEQYATGQRDGEP